MRLHATLVGILAGALWVSACASRDRVQAVEAPDVQAAGPTVDLSSAQDAFAQSLRYETDKQYAAAEEIIRPLADGGDEFAQLRLAWLAYQSGNYKLSAARYQRLVERRPAMVDARLGLMLPLMAQFRWREAAAQAQAVLSAHPGQYIAHIRLLACEEALKQWDVADSHAEELAALYPSDTDVQILAARAKAGRRNAAEARRAYTNVLLRSPSNQEAQLYLKAHP
jgi:tetratricopeptide (TPR) repeat protein